MPSLRDVVMEMLSGRANSRADTEIDIDFDQLSSREDSSTPLPAREGMWKQSSFDLLNGLEVSEELMDTMPDELIEAFFKS